MDEQEPGGAPDPLRAAMQPMAEISRRVAEAIRSATLNTPRDLPGTDLTHAEGLTLGRLRDPICP